MIELTPEQQEALEKHNGEPVIVYDPRSRCHYVLMPTEDYETLTGAPLAALGDGVTGVSPLMLRSQQAFWRDLPELLKKWRYRDKWVAYHGDERIAIAKSGTELVQLCLARGLQRGDFYLGKIEYEPYPPWVCTPIEESLFEFTDDEPLPPSTES
jgi:hypothetical protein